MAAATSYETIIAETHGAVGLIRLNRPQALNALSALLIRELNAALDTFEADDAIGALVLTGSARAFAAGADIAEMQPKTSVSAYLENFIGDWEHRLESQKTGDRGGRRLRARRRLRDRHDVRHHPGRG